MMDAKRHAMPLVGFASKTKMEMFFWTACTDENAPEVLEKHTTRTVGEFVFCTTNMYSIGAQLGSKCVNICKNGVGAGGGLTGSGCIYLQLQQLCKRRDYSLSG